MAAHEVKLEIRHAIPIGSKDVEFPIRVDNAPLGRVQISTGSIDWLPSPKSKSGYWLSWSDFADLMEKRGNPK